jgi:hypothetical protein
MSVVLPIHIHIHGNHSVIHYSGEELKRCLELTGTPVSSEDTGGSVSKDKKTIQVGTMKDLGISCSRVADPALDDAIYIAVQNGNGIIAGINPRSVLLAVYRYLTEIGCRWIRPRADGEIIPDLRGRDLPPVHVEEAASYRHRGVCIEGSVSVEHVRNMVEWLPRIGMNSYFIQFREAYDFFDRWYHDSELSPMKGQRLTVEQACEYTAKVVEEIKKRDMVFHAVGHGWTCEPFGERALGWQTKQSDAPEHIKPYLAEVAGKRDWWAGVPLNTNLCYSNPEVRNKIVIEVVDYVRKNPQVDLLHFWLADGSNNQCECEACRLRPADYYVIMLNGLAERFREENLKTRIAFLMYVDLMWPPIQEKIQDPERFVLMFAPITRTYRKMPPVHHCHTELPPYVRNKLEWPKNLSENATFLYAWQKVFDGDSFDFDYHLQWAHFNDPGYAEISEVLHQDIQELEKIGLNGLISCQHQRVFFPIALPMVVMGRTLWKKQLTYSTITEDYFASAFGDKGSLCHQYLQRLSSLYPDSLREDKPKVSKENIDNLNQMIQLIQDFMPLIDRNLHQPIAAQAKSWIYLKHHTELHLSMAKMHKARAEGDDVRAQALWQENREQIRSKVQTLHNVFDEWFFICMGNSLFSK